MPIRALYEKLARRCSNVCNYNNCRRFYISLYGVSLNITTTTTMKFFRLFLALSLLQFAIGCSTKAPLPAQLVGRQAVARQIPFGQDTLGAARYREVNRQSLSLSPGQGRGHFSSTFGDIVPVLRDEAKQGVSFVRVHLMWRDLHNFSVKDFPAIEKEANRICPVIRANPQVKWYLSGACEHKLSEKDARALAKLVLKACPQAQYVNTPMSAGAVLAEYINEFHGHRPKNLPPRFAFSCDGTACEDANIEKLKQDFAGAEYFMIWGPRYNGRWESNDTTPRPQRKGWPDLKYISSMAYLATAKGIVSLLPNWLWKSHSENKGTGDPRAEKPVAIIPIKTNELVLKQGSKIVHRMPFYGTFSDGRFRYYASKWGFELGKVDLWIAGAKKGNVNAGFRDGSFR